MFLDSIICHQLKFEAILHSWYDRSIKMYLLPKTNKKIVIYFHHCLFLKGACKCVVKVVDCLNQTLVFFIFGMDYTPNHCSMIQRISNLHFRTAQIIVIVSAKTSLNCNFFQMKKMLIFKIVFLLQVKFFSMLFY